MDELDALPIDWTLQRSGVILQREVKGIRHNVHFTAKDGILYGCSHSIAVRTNIPNGTGLAVAGITVKPDGKLIEYTRALIEELAFSGVGCAQYIVNEETGEETFLELNPRLPGLLTFVEFAGLPMSSYLFDLVMSGDPDLTAFRVRDGIRYSWVSEDLKTIKAGLRAKELSLGQAMGWAAKMVWAGLVSEVDVGFSGTDCVPGNRALIRELPGGRFFIKSES